MVLAGEAVITCGIGVLVRGVTIIEVDLVFQLFKVHITLMN